LPNCAQWCSHSRADSPKVGDWVAKGNCADVDMDPTGRRNNLEAKLTCLLCPVKVECLKTACENREPMGIWGASSPGERNKMGRFPSQDQIDAHFDRVTDLLERAGL
jgi:WhiB family redox-sensing transcriptional regulator